MKKLIMTIAIVLGMGMASFAQEEVTFEERGLFGKGVDGAKGGLFGLVPPQDPYSEDNQDAEDPEFDTYEEEVPDPDPISISEQFLT